MQPHPGASSASSARGPGDGGGRPPLAPAVPGWGRARRARPGPVAPVRELVVAAARGAPGASDARGAPGPGRRRALRGPPGSTASERPDGLVRSRAVLIRDVLMWHFYFIFLVQRPITRYGACLHPAGAPASHGYCIPSRVSQGLGRAPSQRPHGGETIWTLDPD